jgi:tetratricopeptide (TPR) repeat protein
MSKRNFPTRIDQIHLPRRMREGLEEAERLLAQDKPQEALDLLTELDRQFPRQPDILGWMANANLEMGNGHGYLHAIYKLHELLPNRAEVKAGLAGAYLSNGYLALAIQTFSQFLKRWPNDERASDIQKTIPELEMVLEELLLESGNSLETGFELACLHDEVRLQMDLGNYARCRQQAKKLLQQKPDFIPVLNNLSQVSWLEGDLPKAIETCQQVLEKEPRNVHALSNMTRFLFMLGKKEESGRYANKLKESTAEAADRWTKVTEALSFICDDDGVLAVLEDVKRKKEQDQLHETVWHSFAVAEYRKGNIPQAKAYWKKCLKLAPYFDLASKNLEELKKPIYERSLPQAFTLDVWIPRSILASMISTIERATQKKNDSRLQAEIIAYISRHPELIHFVPAALTNGDEQCREFALQLADMSAHHVILDSLKEFSLGQLGSDAQRLDASQILSKHGIFRSGERIDLWLEGERKPIMMLGFQITYDAVEQHTLKPAAQHLMEQAIHALHEGNGAKGEGYLRKAIEIQKDEPGLYNNLAVALSMQGKHEESEAIADDIPNRFPEYFFGQVITVRKAIGKHDLVTAKTMLDKMMQRHELHVTEFGALCACQIDYLIENDKPEGAVTWWEMWQQGYPEDPARENYEDKMSLLSSFAQIQNRLSRPRRRNKKKSP